MVGSSTCGSKASMSVLTIKDHGQKVFEAERIFNQVIDSVHVV